MARWPGKIKAGQVSDQIWAFWDFLPTAAELAGANPPRKLIDGISIVPTLLGNPNLQKQHEYLYWEFNQKQAIRTGDWFAHRKSGGSVELYDLSKDPQQKQDVADQHPKTATRGLRWMTESHTPSEVWPSPGESKAAFQRRLKESNIPARPKNVDG